MKRVGLFAAVIIVAAGIGQQVPRLTLCATEDSANCVWLASVQGNGTGRSFIDIGGTPHYFR